MSEDNSINISNTTIDLGRDETKIEIAKAVQEAMKVLQFADSSPTYGIYIEAQKPDYEDCDK